ncbi:NeuD/PglB/VioB family sugar acetyltransferase [Actinoplanes sp. NPDC051859]|uniref:NeuD/PglB/VioB family sugar acetyltransferase n=1 Tax=Actinoplanes sp. NPDC051859 TaxID=3363909 RepID=UPI0037948157
MQFVVLGASGHAREVAWIAGTDPALALIGFIGPAGETGKPLPAPRLGDDSWFTEAPDEVGFLIGIGDGRVRRRLAGAAEVSARSAPAVAHPNAVIGSDTSRKPGSIIWPGAVLTTGISVGSHAHVSTNVAVGHDVVIGDFATLLPGCTVGGFTEIGEAAVIGAGASVLEGKRIGAGAVVGAGALVRTDVPPNTTVVGVPARPLKVSADTELRR